MYVENVCMYEIQTAPILRSWQRVGLPIRRYRIRTTVLSGYVLHEKEGPPTLFHVKKARKRWGNYW